MNGRNRRSREINKKLKRHEELDLQSAKGTASMGMHTGERESRQFLLKREQSAVLIMQQEAN